MRDGMMLVGRVLKVERRKWERDGRSGERLIVHVLADVTVYEANVGQDYKGPLPEVGQVGTWPVEVRAFRRSGGDAGLAIDLVAEAVTAEDSPARALATV